MTCGQNRDNLLHSPRTTSYKHLSEKLYQRQCSYFPFLLCSGPLKLLSSVLWQWPAQEAVVSVSLTLSISPWPWLCLLFVHSLPQPASLFQRHKQKNGTLNLNRTASGRVELQSVLSRRFPPPWHTLVEVENNWIKETARSLCNTSDFGCSAETMRLNWLQLTNGLSPY